jgi:hypothetical protein
MWKNIFLESCLLSALIFGGLYINASSLKEELYEKEQKSHISGASTPLNHISGEKKKEDRNNISGSSFSTEK